MREGSYVLLDGSPMGLLPLRWMMPIHFIICGPVSRGMFRKKDLLDAKQAFERPARC